MVVQWNGGRYRIVDCGGGDDSFFHSFLYALWRAGKWKGKETPATLRELCTEMLGKWTDAFPERFKKHVIPPDTKRVAKPINGESGDNTSILATLASGYSALKVTIVWQTKDGFGNCELAADSTDATLYLYRNGAHYQALIRLPDIEEEPNPGPSKGGASPSGKSGSNATIPAKLSTGQASLSKGISTITQDNSAVEIHLLDVGQGEATLILVRDKAGIAGVVLIDGGRVTRGGGTILRHLQQLNIGKIDHMICTHYDADHIEGLTTVLESPITVEKVWIPRSLFKNDDPKNGRVDFLPDKHIGLANAIKARSQQQRMKDNQCILWGDLSLTCLSSGTGIGFESNDDSIALRVQFKSFAYYTAGDLSSGIEDGLIEAVLGTAKHLCAMKCGTMGPAVAPRSSFWRRPARRLL